MARTIGYDLTYGVAIAPQAYGIAFRPDIACKDRGRVYEPADVQAFFQEALFPTPGEPTKFAANVPAADNAPRKRAAIRRFRCGSVSSLKATPIMLPPYCR